MLFCIFGHFEGWEVCIWACTCQYHYCPFPNRYCPCSTTRDRSCRVYGLDYFPPYIKGFVSLFLSQLHANPLYFSLGLPVSLLSFVAGTSTYKSLCWSVGWSICWSVCWSVGLSHFTSFAFMGILRVGKFVFEHAPAQITTDPAQLITAPAKLITAPAQPPAIGVVVYTALFRVLSILKTKEHQLSGSTMPVWSKANNTFLSFCISEMGWSNCR